MHFYETWVFILLIGFAQATSVLLGPNKLRHLSPVSNIQTIGDSVYDPVTFTFQIPFEQHLSNLERRWYIQADPNARNKLGNINLPLTGGDSGALYSYLTRNSSVEVPRSHLTFKVVLYPHEQRIVRVNGEDFDDMTTTDGQAYREVETVHGKSWKPVGWARFVLHNDTDQGLRYQGAFEVNDQHGLGFPAAIYHFSTVANLQAGLDQDEIDAHIQRRSVPEDYVVWRDFDVRETTKTSPLSNLNEVGLNNYTFLEEMSAHHLFRRDDANDTTNGFSSNVNLYSTIGNSSGCPTKRQVALVGLLADCNYISDFTSTSNLRQHLLDMINQASHLYESAFNISLGLSDIIIADNSSCPDNGTEAEPWNYQCSSGSNALSDRLGRLTEWRNMRSNDSLATWSLMTKCDAGSVVGLSWLGMVCQSTDSSAAGTNVISRTALDYLVIAHEIGHSFGAVHDCTSDTCSQGYDKSSQCCPRAANECVGDDNLVFVMNPASTESIANFSSCSQGNICSGILSRSVNTTCLQANTGGLRLYSNNTCGNGIVEEGEECDCGGVDGCGDNSCCDPTTCKFKDGAVCDDANDVCCNSCQYADSSVICRASTGSCDYAEYCTGNSTGCPTDRYASDGTSCKLDNSNGTTSSLTCMSGHCSSRDLQCQTLMGNYTDSSGQSLGIVKACDDDSTCILTCQALSYGSGTCVSTNSYFLDGTPCGGSGRCSNGKCVGGSSSNGFWGGGGDGNGSSFPWRWVVVAVAVFIGILVLGFIFGIVTRNTRRSPVGVQRKPVIPPPGRVNAPPPPGNVPAPGYYDQNFSPVNPNSYYYADIPQPPAQAYHPGNNRY